jgi:hypothetical protein
VLVKPHARAGEHVVNAASGHSSSLPHPDTSNATDQPTPAELGPLTSSSNYGKGQVVTPVEPFIQQQQQQQQQPLSGAPLPTQPWSALPVILGLIAEGS